MTYQRLQRWVDPLVIGAFIVGSAGAIGMLEFSSRDTRVNLGVIFAPWTDARSTIERVAAANATLVRMGSYPFIVIVRSDAPDLAARMWAQGAFMIVGAHKAVGCAPRRSASK